jgi:hypothetical protein
MAAQSGITFIAGTPQTFGPVSIGKAHKYTNLVISGWSNPATTLTIQVENFINGVWRQKFETRLRGDASLSPHPIEFTFDRGATQVRAIVTAAGGNITINSVTVTTK